MPSPPARLGVAALSAALILGARVSPARAEAPSDSEVSRRIAWIQDRLDRGTPAAQRWWYGWYTGYTALSVGQAGVALGTTNKGLRTGAAYGAVISTFGLIPLMVLPYAPLGAAAALHRAPESTPEERRKKLALAERLLKKCAEAEALGGSWFAHVLGGVVSIAGGVGLAAGFHRVGSGILDAVGGVAITEAQIFTRPTAAIGDLRAYQAFAAPAGTGALALDLSLAAVPGGAGLTLRF